MKTPEAIKDHLTLSATAVKQFMKSPQHFVQYRLDGSQEDDTKTPLGFGAAYHTWILQRDIFFMKYAILDENKRPFPDKNYQTKANRDWKQEFFDQCIEEGKLSVTTAEFDQIKEMADILMARPEAAELISYTRAKFERSVEWIKRGVKFRGFIDIDADVFFADLKTTVNADPETFQRDIWKYRYDIQGACYSDARAGGKRLFGKHDPFYIIAQEKTSPYGVSVHILANDVLDKAYEDLLNAVDAFNQCLKDDYWPGYEIKAPAMLNGEVNEGGLFPTSRPPWIK
jgi:hypothetical protein